MKKTSQEFRLKIIGETRDHFIVEIKHNELMSKKQQKVSTTLNYVEKILILASVVSRMSYNFCFASLVDIPVGITSSAIRIKVCARTEGIKKYRSIIM